MPTQKIAEHFNPGDIITFYNDPDNAPHHTTLFGKLIQFVQSIFWKYSEDIDPRVTHLSLVDKVAEDDEVIEDGYTPLWTIDILIGQVVHRKKLEHNFATHVYRLHPEKTIHSSFTPQDLSKKAHEVATALLGVPYRQSTILDVFYNWSHKEGRRPGPEYTRWLVKRFQINVRAQSFGVNTKEDGFVCAEFVLGSYQIAYLLLAGNEALNQALPDWLNFHMHTTPAGLAQFFSKNEYFEKVPAEHINTLRYSGRPHPGDWGSSTYVLRYLAGEGDVTLPSHPLPADQHGSLSEPVVLRQRL